MPRAPLFRYTEAMDDAALIAGLRTGDPRAVRTFCDRYGAALERVAEARLAQGLRARVGPEDVVQSVYRTFFRRAGDGQFELADAADLWHLLCAITLTKVREQARFHLRQRRGVDREVALDAAPDDRPLSLAGTARSPAEAAEVAELLDRVLATLDPEEQRIVDLKLRDVTNDAIALELGCSERTVRRLLKRLSARFHAILDADADDVTAPG